MRFAALRLITSSNVVGIARQIGREQLPSESGRRKPPAPAPVLADQGRSRKRSRPPARGEEPIGIHGGPIGRRRAGCVNNLSRVKGSGHTMRPV